MRTYIGPSITLGCAEFLTARVAKCADDVQRHDAERITRILWDIGDGRRRWHTAHIQSSFGEAILYLFPITVFMNGNLDANGFWKNEWADKNWS